MAKIQRGDSDNPDSSPDRGIRDEMVDKLDSSDDDVPEEVTFEDSKASALQSVKNALESSKREKEVLKEKRKKRQLLFQEQKKKRLLPKNVLEEFDAVPTQLQQLPENEDDKVPVETKKAKRKTKPRSLQGNYTIMRVKDIPTTTSLQERAKDFIQSRLYGAGTRRTTNGEMLSLERKRGLNKRAAVDFVNNKWGADKKAKAEKCNKRFIHRKKLVVS